METAWAVSYTHLDVYKRQPEKTVKHITEHTQEKEDKDVGEQEEQETEWEEVKRRTDDLLLTQSLSRELGLDNDPNKRQP